MALSDMGDTWITDITDFPSPLDSVAEDLRPAFRLATYLGTIVSAATSSPPGEVVESARLGEFEAYAALYQLVSAGLVRAGATATAAAG